MEYFPFDFKVSPVYAYLHSSLLNTSSSPELLPLPSVLDLFFAVFKYLYALPPFSLSGQGSGNFSNENSCSLPESIFLYIKALHSFFTPLVKAHFRLCTSCTVLLYFLSSLHAVPPLGCCWPSCLYLCTYFSVSNHDSVPDCLFFFFPLFLDPPLLSSAHLRLPIAL